MLTDTHCHLYLEDFASDIDQVIERARNAGVVRILVPGLDSSSSLNAITLADRWPEVYVAVGFHPTEIGELSDIGLESVRRLATHPKVVAIGEVGLDYYWVKDNQKQEYQRYGLRKQLALAIELNKPVILHLREQDDADHGACSDDLIQILEDWMVDLKSGKSALIYRPGVLHSFSGNIPTAMRAMELGFCIGVTGPVTYKNAELRRQVIAAIPLESILIETDAPFLAPHPYRGKRNEPAYVAHIADKIAQIHSRTPQEVASVTRSNATRIFAWGDID